MTSKHYRWQTRWQVDHSSGTAQHDTGLMVRVVGGQPQANNAQQVQQQLAIKHGHNAAEMVRRLLKEAGQLLNKDTSHASR